MKDNVSDLTFQFTNNPIKVVFGLKNFETLLILRCELAQSIQHL